MCTKTILAVFCIMMITACDSGGSGSADPAAAPAPGSSTPNLATPGAGTDPLLVVYSITTQQHVTIGSTHYTLPLTGSCAVYKAQTYCWDDGWHRAGSTFGMTYWGLVSANPGLTQGNEGVADLTDPFADPVNMSTAASEVVASATFNATSLDTMMNDVVTNGTQTQVNCNDNGVDTLDCGSFQLTY